ncbi:MAG TPA: hypothetical protein VFR03_01535 [Thermoanaerobaculia bacterium]|nr:hypothetical protein [Thermoanaerobaculia bacterium]
MKTRILALAVVALFLAAFAASAQTGTWTAVGSTGAIDPASVGISAVFGGTRLGFSSGTGNTIITRFNVTNTFGGAFNDVTPWTTLELGAVGATAVDIVKATLYKVIPCTGARSAICSVTNTSNVCASCFFPAGTINFGANLYYVEVTISRTTTTASPQLSTLRIF